MNKTGSILDPYPMYTCIFEYFQSKSNMVTPRNGEPLIAAIQDFITGDIIYINSSHESCSIGYSSTYEELKWYVALSTYTCSYNH